jgi:hypothetical protein
LWRHPLNSFIKVTSPPNAPELEQPLWREPISSEWAAPPNYYEVALEQYKLYVEMADRISARRAATNTFFLTLHTAILTLVAVFWQTRPTGSPWLLLAPLIVVIGLCWTWFALVRSYRQLNGIKWAVVGAFELRLPTSPFGLAEWEGIGRGKDPARYLPFTHVEQWIPATFALAYVSGAAVAILSSTT